jgi:hypothetical protein
MPGGVLHIHDDQCRAFEYRLSMGHEGLNIVVFVTARRVHRCTPLWLLGKAYFALYPPSSQTTWLVMKDAASDSRKSLRLAISTGSPKGPWECHSTNNPAAQEWF